jgi:hypothetical protein
LLRGFQKALGAPLGSACPERCLDPNDSRIPYDATGPGAPSLDGFYDGRILENRQFAP